jgi:hypothetical protein
MSLQPVCVAGAGGLEIAGRNSPALIADAVHGDNAAAMPEKPEEAAVELSPVPELKEAVTQGLGKRFAVILAMPQPGQPRHDGGEVSGITGLEVVEKFLHGAPSFLGFVELDREFHGTATSILM